MYSTLALELLQSSARVQGFRSRDEARMMGYGAACSRERERRLEPLLEVEEWTPSRIFQRLAIIIEALGGDLLL